MFKCNRPNCSLCQHLLEQNYFDFNGKIFYVNATMSCDVKNVLYAINCLRCDEYYIGQKLRDRLTVHAQQIRDPSTKKFQYAHIWSFTHPTETRSPGGSVGQGLAC